MSYFECRLNRRFWRSKKVVQVIQNGGTLRHWEHWEKWQATKHLKHKGFFTNPTIITKFNKASTDLRTTLLQWKKWSSQPEIEMQKWKFETALMMVEEDVYRSLMSIGLLGLQSFDNWRLPALGETFEVWTSFKDGNGERYLYFDGDCCWRCCKAKCSTVKMFNCSLTMVSLIGWRGLQERISV